MKLLEDKQLLTGTIVVVLAGALAILSNVVEISVDLSWANDGV